MVSEVESMLRKKQYHEIMIDNQMLSTLARWLRPMPDGSLVSLQVRRALLSSLLRSSPCISSPRRSSHRRCSSSRSSRVREGAAVSAEVNLLLLLKCFG